jgi:hypothetical protein
MSTPLREIASDCRVVTDWPPGKLWSLWDMLEKYALLFTVATVGLSEAKWLCIPLQLQPGEKQVPREMIERAAAHGLRIIRQAAILSDMDDVLPELDRLEQLIWPPHKDMPLAPLNGIAQAINHLISRLQDELNSQYFFHLDQKDVQFYLEEKPFGQKVADKFEQANEDICEAAKCLSLQRSTACVFHLMRVLELGVQAFGKKLKVKLDVRAETWHQILLHVNKEIQAMPSKTTKQKSKKSQYAAAAAHLQSVRLAWRNEVMHPKCPSEIILNHMNRL